MPEFRYKAKDREGVAHVGNIAAPSSSQAANQLRERGWLILQLDGEATSPTRPVDSPSIGLFDRLPPRSVHLETSLQQMAIMLRSGMTLLAAITNVTEQSSHRRLKRIWETIGRQIQAGRRLSDALIEQRCFPEYVVRLVQVGEQTGNLETVIRRAANTMRNRRIAHETLASATIYPLLIVVLSIAVTAYMVVYLIPRLNMYLQSLGKELPAMTQSLIDISVWLRENLPLLAGFTVAFVLLGTFVYLSREGRLLVDQYLLRIPIVGNLLKVSETSTFARSLSMMLKSGITLTEALAAVEKILGNRFLRVTVNEAREQIIRGGNLGDALSLPHTFGPMLPRMAAVAQQTGELDRVMEEVAEMYEALFRSTLNRLNAILTPLVTIGIGIIVGYVYIAFFVALVAAGS